MLKRIVKSLQLACLMLLANITMAEQTIQLRVSATIPPRPCQYPNHCELVEPSATTKVTVDDGVIRYVGSPPSVTQTEELITILF